MMRAPTYRVNVQDPESGVTVMALGTTKKTKCASGTLIRHAEFRDFEEPEAEDLVYCHYSSASQNTGILPSGSRRPGGEGGLGGGGSARRGSSRSDSPSSSQAGGRGDDGVTVLASCGLQPPASAWRGVAWRRPASRRGGLVAARGLFPKFRCH